MMNLGDKMNAQNIINTDTCFVTWDNQPDYNPLFTNPNYTKKQCYFCYLSIQTSKLDEDYIFYTVVHWRGVQKIEECDKSLHVILKQLRKSLKHTESELVVHRKEYRNAKVLKIYEECVKKEKEFIRLLENLKNGV